MSPVRRTTGQEPPAWMIRWYPNDITVPPRAKQAAGKLFDNRPLKATNKFLIPLTENGSFTSMVTLISSADAPDR